MQNLRAEDGGVRKWGYLIGVLIIRESCYLGTILRVTLLGETPTSTATMPYCKERARVMGVSAIDAGVCGVSLV